MCTISVCQSQFVTVVIFYILVVSHSVWGQNQTPCPLGFYGTDCSRVCTSDGDCVGGSSDTCYSEFTFLTMYPTIPKSFTCKATSPDLVTSLIEPGSVEVQCYASDTAKGGNCSFTFGIQDYANDVSCEALQCDTGGSTISCGSIGCQCVSDANCTTASSFVKAFVGGVQGPASFTCEKQDGQGACTLNVPEFLVPEIGVTCTTGQCIPKAQMIDEDTLNAPSLEYNGTSVNTALNACIAAIPTIVLCLMSVMVLLYWLKISPLYDDVHCTSAKGDVLMDHEMGDHCLAWSHVSVDMPMTRQMRSRALKGNVAIGGKDNKNDRVDRLMILAESSGEALSGEVVGVLGPSGCGKTTLLSALSGDSHGMLRTMNVSGAVYLDGESIDPRRVAFLPQEDSLIPTMTVRENLVFTGILKLDVPRDDVKQRVESILQDLGISDIAESYVGGSSNIRGISGGERRRVTIGMALVSDPECIVLDEPLSGLDSYNALVVTKTLRALAKKGRVVMYSMHQPSDDMFNALDKVIFLAHGRIAYQGSPAGARQILSTLDTLHGRPIADSVIDVLSNREMLSKILETEKSEPLSHDEVKHASMSWKKDSRRTSGICLQTALLVDRTLKDVWRNKSLLVLHVAISICAGLIIGGIFYNVSLDTDGVQARYGSIFISLCFLAFTSITSIDLLVNERMIVTAEVKEGLYNGSLYILSKLFIDGLFLRALPATLYAIPFYFMVGFIYDAARFFSFLFVLILFNLCIGALAMLVTTCSKTAGTSLFVMNTLLLFQLALTGFLVEVDSITPVLRWIHWLSQFYYAFEAMITTEMNQNKYNLILEAPGLKPIILEDTPGEMFIDTLGYQVDTATRNICILIGYYYGFVCLCLAAFYIRINLPALPEKNVCLLPGSFVKLSARRDLSPALFHTIIEQFSSSIESGKSTEVDEADVVVGFEKQETSRSHNVNRFRRIAVSAKVIEFRQSSSQGFVVLQILSRVRIVTLKDGPCAQISPCTEELGDASKVETLLSEITKTLESLLPSGGKESSKMMMSMKNPSQPGMIADILGSMLTRDVGKRQVLLETLCVEKRLEIVLKMLKLLSVKQTEKSPSTSEVESTYLKKLEDNKAPKEIVQAAQKEIEKLQKMSEHHPGYSAQLVYLDTISSLPWNVFSASNPFGTMNLDEIQEDLDRHHFGMVDVKKRILEYIAVRILNQDQSSARAPPIVLLVGPPGTGKTSIARSIASCLKKPFQRISLGGVRDEAEIRGHRRTYIGAMPGKFITAMNKCGQSDPVILVDELDKISSTIGATRGDPASAMLELFDPEQNKEFMDHYIGLPFDMSRVTFISTANTTDTIPKPLLDRTEIIHLPGYTIPEKKNIARQHLLPKVLSKNGLNNTTLVLSDTAMEHLITGYTMEGGVRGLYKALDALCRYFVVKTVRDIEKKKRIWNIDEAMIEKILGPTKFSDATHQNAYRVQSPGTAAGLVWTPYGGSIQYIECIKVPHKLEKSRLVLTGRMGEVLNESATLAMNWVTSNLTDTFADSGDNLVNYSIHIHLPSGAVKKDGPSAGVTILVALVSLVTGACVRSDTALTGEITLRGHVLPVGGIREKLIAAHSAGLSRVIIPSRNLGEAKKCIQDDDMQNLTLIPVSHVEQAIENAFKTPIMLNHAEYIHTAKL